MGLPSHKRTLNKLDIRNFSRKPVSCEGVTSFSDGAYSTWIFGV